MSETLGRDIERMQAELHELRTKEAEIADQLNLAKMRAREGGIFANSTWFRRASLALRKTRADIHQRQQALKLLYRRWTYLQQSSTEQNFIKIARENLPPEQFQLWWQQALANTPETLQ